MIDITSNEPIKLETKNGHKVTLRPFVPPRMSNETRGVFLRYAKMNPNIAKGKVDEDDSSANIEFKDGIPAEIINEINEITLRRMVLEIDGKTGDEVLNYVLDHIRQEDYLEIVNKCNEISQATTLTDQKKSASAPSTPGR